MNPSHLIILHSSLRRAILAAASCISIGVPALADEMTESWRAQIHASEQEWRTFIHPTTDTFELCLMNEVYGRISSSGTAAEIADAAMIVCEKRLEPLRGVLAVEPFNKPQHVIDEVMSRIKSDERAAAANEVLFRRQQ